MEFPIYGAMMIAAGVIGFKTTRTLSRLGAVVALVGGLLVAATASALGSALVIPTAVRGYFETAGWASEQVVRSFFFLAALVFVGGFLGVVAGVRAGRRPRSLAAVAPGGGADHSNLSPTQPAASTADAPARSTVGGTVSRFRIEGTYTRGSSTGPWSVSARSEEEARKQAATLGILVTAVEPLPLEGGLRMTAAPLIRPRPDLASGTRRWPELIMRDWLSGPRQFVGGLIAVAVALCLTGIFWLYLELVHRNVTAKGNGLLLVALSVAVWLTSALSRFGRRFRSVPARVAYAVVLVACVWGGGALLFTVLAQDAGSVLAQCFLVMALLSAAVALILRLSRLGKRLRAAHALRTLRHDRRPPVLLLRAFRDDQVGVPNVRRQRPWWAQGWTVAEAPSASFEEVLCQRLAACGPVVAIGRPGEVVAPLGASRFWVRDDRWQQVIDDLLRESQLVVMIMGATAGEDGLAWEVRRTFQAGQDAKLVLVLPPLNEDVARERWESFRRLCQDRLPPYRGGEVAASFTGGRGAVARVRLRAGNRSGPSDEDYRVALTIGAG